jgi:tRNA 2-thiouridine synthesizing protein A
VTIVPSAADDCHVIDGGDRACGELLMAILRQTRHMPGGTIIRILAEDPAAPIDIPAWCHLTGHRYQGQLSHEGRPAYDVILSGIRQTGTNPWRPPAANT